MEGLLFSKEKDVPFVISTINKQHSHVDGCWSSFNWVVGFMIQVVQLLLIRWNSVQSMCIWIVITKEQYKQASKGNIIHIPFTENTCLAFIPKYSFQFVFVFYQHYDFTNENNVQKNAVEGTSDSVKMLAVGVPTCEGPRMWIISMLYPMHPRVQAVDDSYSFLCQTK